MWTKKEIHIRQWKNPIQHRSVFTVNWKVPRHSTTTKKQQPPHKIVPEPSSSPSFSHATIYLCDFTFMRFLVSSYSKMILILSLRNPAFLDLLFSLLVHFLVCSSVCKSSTQFSFVREYTFLDTCLTEECKCGEWCMNDWCFSSGNFWELSLWGFWLFFNLYFRAIHASSHSVNRQLWSWLKCLHRCCFGMWC